MKYSISSIYSSPVPQLQTRLAEAIDEGLREGSGSAVVFFRADDAGVPSRLFFEMTALFKKHRAPLCLAVVPAWLTGNRWHRLRQDTSAGTTFCWHQHGWLHMNHERAGKKQEFGESRSAEDLRRDLLRGRKRLTQLIGADFFPFFTPPWNRCGQKTLGLLEKLHFKGVSRSSGAVPSSQRLPDIQVNVDLHTRKEENPEQSLQALLAELRSSMASGTCGIMLHHQRMNGNALLLLDQLLQATGDFSTLRLHDFRSMTA